MRQPELYFVNNVTSGINLLEAMRAARKKIVFSSSCATYGEPGSADIDESTLQSPMIYGESALFEKMLRWYSGTATSVPSRCDFNACGTAERWARSYRQVPPDSAVLRGAGGNPTWLGDDYDTDGACIRDYVHVVDLAGLLAAGRDQHNWAQGAASQSRRSSRRAAASPAIDPAIISPPTGRSRTAALPPAGKRRAFTEIDEIVATAWRWHQLTRTVCLD